VSLVAAGSNYCYALVPASNEVYSWGMGYNYVLGTREEDNVHQPIKVHPMQFHNNQVKVIGTGS
jgi:alpha-tubulin suppressor-like RCC1 family protein